MALSSLWIKVSTQLPRHPKTKKAADALGISVPELVGRLCMLWIYCAEFRPSGFLTGPEELSVAMDWQGEPLRLADALANIPCFNGFLDRHDDSSLGFYVHDWEIFNNGAANTTEKRKGKKIKEENAREARDHETKKDFSHPAQKMPPGMEEKLKNLFKKNDS